jgi:hypothetical protein
MVNTSVKQIDGSFCDYIAKNFISLYTKNTGQTNAFKMPTTPFQKPMGVYILSRMWSPIPVLGYKKFHRRLYVISFLELLKDFVILFPVM